MTDTPEQPKRRGRPPTGVTPSRNVRIGDDLWEAVKATAADRGETVTAAIERALRRYVREHQRRGPHAT